MAQYRNPLEALLSGLGAGVQQGTQSVLEEARGNREARRKARMEFAARDAMSREGSAQELQDVFMQGIKPPEQQREDVDVLTSLMGPGMRETAPPAWAGSNAQPRMEEVPSQFKSAEELFGRANLEKDAKGNVIPGGENTSVGIPQISTRLRQLQSQRLIPQTARATGTRAARAASGPQPEKERDVARDTLTDFAKTREIKESILPDLLRKNPELRTRFTQQYLNALRSANLPIPPPERVAELVRGVIGPELGYTGRP